MQCPKCGNSDLKLGGLVNDNRGKLGQQRYKCAPCGWHGVNVAGGEKPTATSRARAKEIRSAKGVQRYVITAAQNATPPNAAFLDTLHGYCAHNGAKLLVIPYRYKNPTSLWSKKAKDDDWWHPDLAPLLIDQRIHLNDNLTLLADLKTQPTASAPTQGFETITGARSAIIGHPKLELQTLPTPQSKLPKLLMTTGAVTRPNYIESKAGKKGEHHHTAAAVVVEIKGKIFHVRQLVAARDGSFCDFDKEYSGAKVAPMAPEAIVFGDVHVDHADPTVTSAHFGPEGLVTALKPKRLVWNDVFDGATCNPHHGFFNRVAQHRGGRFSILGELERCWSFIRDNSGRSQSIIVSSNHHDFLGRWVKSHDPRSDVVNVGLWATLFQYMAAATKLGAGGAETPDPFIWLGRQALPGVKFLEADESCMIAGVEVGMHGDRGPNGSRGSIKSFGKIGVRSVIGHSHTPGIRDGVYQVGTNSRLRLEYNRGPSSWLHTDCLIYKNGKRSLINIIDGEWRA